MLRHFSRHKSLKILYFHSWRERHYLQTKHQRCTGSVAEDAQHPCCYGELARMDFIMTATVGK